MFKGLLESWLALNARPVGKVYLVGAGPGHPELITVKALKILQQAEVILYDHLVNPVLLKEAPPEAAQVCVGKRAGRHTIGQEKINDLLIEYARQGKRVVRLKGGDPFVFGRGGEELEALQAAGIPYEVVPGVSSAIAVPAYAGIPVTHRHYTSSFTVVTGHERSSATETETEQTRLDWEALARVGGTLIFLMGLSHLSEITGKLIAAGLDPATAAAVIESGTTARQRVIYGQVSTIAAQAQSQAFQPSAITVIGQVAGLGQILSWFNPQSEQPDPILSRRLPY